MMKMGLKPKRKKSEHSKNEYEALEALYNAEKQAYNRLKHDNAEREMIVSELRAEVEALEERCEKLEEVRRKEKAWMKLRREIFSDVAEEIKNVFREIRSEEGGEDDGEGGK